MRSISALPSTAARQQAKLVARHGLDSVVPHAMAISIGDPNAACRKSACHQKLLVLTTQPGELITLGDSQSETLLLLPAALFAIRQRNRFADRLCGGFELAGEVNWIATGHGASAS